jgi:hypothetical protein
MKMKKVFLIDLPAGTKTLIKDGSFSEVIVIDGKGRTHGAMFWGPNAHEIALDYQKEALVNVGTLAKWFEYRGPAEGLK